jgi:tRNA-splicing ligase RtcB (3'-phosphate/5'-hydroxy nucleic acid ligase)
MELNRIHQYLWEIPRTGKMLVPGRVYATRELLADSKSDESLQQVCNVAHLPGIVNYSLAMPDIHWGYGFPIGGVAAMRPSQGVISPGGVGYDINCGVRLLATQLAYSEIKEKIPGIVTRLFQAVPAGVGSSGAIPRLSRADQKRILETGAKWAIERGYGSSEDIDYMEEGGCLEGADAEVVSEKAKERGSTQAGTLGSGNHFLEVDVIEEVYLPEVAAAYGLVPGNLAFCIHSGSRGLGYQVCDDFLGVMGKAMRKYDIAIPDRQLACAPIESPEGRQYLSAMAAAANFAWANRQVMAGLVEQALLGVLNISPKTLGFRLVYDVCHNIAKFERHSVGGKQETLCVHRKGATRAFPPGSNQIPAAYREWGQPVLIPGDMGTASYVLAGTAQAMEETFGTSCHGAGRVKSRTQALKMGQGRDLFEEMSKRGVKVMATGRRTVAEEMPDAYKNIHSVVDAIVMSGISRKVARLRPVGVVKG